LGGILNFTDRDVDKNELRGFKELLAQEVNGLKVDIKLNKKVTPVYIEQMKPDAVILALGSSILNPSIPGISNAMPALDVYDSASSVVKRVIMVVEGLAGCKFRS
jgi:hypothetical protein